jgi:hypothetical protein
MAADARLIAFHLPQFHPIPENDAWWGKGFTEWTNVTRARPLFPGHQQPKLPADLGFYDLRLPEARAAQADLARAYGIEAFCYWHYWLHGTRLLERPVEEILASGQPDFPFCLGWANHSWEKRWMGGNKEMMVEQAYSAEDDRAHARWLVRAFADPRYFRVGDRPLFHVFNPLSLPEPRRFTDALRDACASEGLADPYLTAGHDPESRIDMRTLGFDITEFHEPQFFRFPRTNADGWSERRLLENLRRGVLSARVKIIDYRESFELAHRRALEVDYPFLPCCMARWDNTPRRGRDGIVMINDGPELFAENLRLCLDLARRREPAERIVFVNAWNEWAEGMYLEPDQKYGHAYLEAVARALGRHAGQADPRSPALAAPGEVSR